jgi:hypothetical protein
MMTLTRRSVLIPAVLWLVFGGGGRAVADLNISTPAGLTPGESFRIIFVTDGTRDGTSGNIGDYNTFVTNDAITEAGGGSNVVKYMGTTLTWSALASTTTTDAINNVGTYGVPVYLASGTLVATTDATIPSGGLWTNTGFGNLTSGISQDLNGSSLYGASVWTGSTTAGTADEPYDYLGSAYPTYGIAGYTNTGWVAWGISPSGSDHLYGISQELTVPSAVPEPSTLWVGAIAGAALITYRWSRRRGALRHQFDA